MSIRSLGVVALHIGQASKAVDRLDAAWARAKKELMIHSQELLLTTGSCITVKPIHQ